MCRQPINSNRPFLVLVKAFGTGKWPIGSRYSVRHYRGRHCRGYVVLWRDSGLRESKNLIGISLTLRTVYADYT